MNQPFRHILLFGVSLLFLATAPGCAMLGGAGKTSENTDGGVNRAFHSAYYTAQVAKVKGDEAGAKEALLSCLDADPEAAVVHYELARIERSAGQWAAALSAAQQAVTFDENNPWYRRELAEVCIELGNLEEADKALTWLLENKPEDDIAANMLLELRMNNGDIKGALEVVQVLEREWGPDPKWDFERHRLHMSMGDFESALADLERLEQDFPEDVGAPLQRARVLQSLGRNEEAETVLSEALNRTNNGRIHLEWARILTLKGNTDQARSHVRLAISSSEVVLAEKMDIAWSYVELAEIQEDLRPEAQALVDLLLDAHPQAAEPHEVLAALKGISGDAEGALLSLKTALDLNPNSPDRWLDALNMAIDLGQWAEVDNMAERAGMLYPNLPVFPYFRGVAKMELDDDRGAERQLKMARNLIVDRPGFESDVLTSLAQIAHDRGEHSASDEWYEQALLANPQNILALNNYAYYLSLRGQRLDRAKELGARVVELAPGEANFEDTYAWVLHQSGDHAEALTWIELALFHEGENPSATVLEHAGDILAALGNMEDARQRWQEALNAGGEAGPLQIKMQGE